MKKLMAMAVAVALLGGVAPALAEINCAQVNRNLQTGRSVQDVAETMVIPEEDVKKCQDEAKKAAGGEAEKGAPDAAAGAKKE